MLFNSFHFLVFFIVITTAFFALPHRFRYLLLLASSCYFYMAFVPIYILILGFTIVIDYFAGIWIEQTEGKRKKWFLVASLVANIGVLAVFKYYNFLNDNLTLLFKPLGIVNQIPHLSILLPIGLSFHTFQAMSYTIEVYRGNQKAERNFLMYSLYVMFYPQLVAGPIERPQNILHQFYEKKYFDYDRVLSGLKLMGWGLFKKAVIADRLAVISDQVFNHYGQYQSAVIFIGVIGFAFQIFCDFSGYSDMAIGAARVMGYDLMINFRRPYAAASISEFWSRWHISLSTWFRDYLYIPLGGNRVSVPRWYFNLFIVFMISGLWHGANWTFILWGALHGFYLIAAIVLDKPKQKLLSAAGLPQTSFIVRFLNMVVTFSLVSFAWIFFRANSIHDAFAIVQKLFAFEEEGAGFKALLKSIRYEQRDFIIAALAIIVMEAVHFYQEKKGSVEAWINARPICLRWGIYYGVLFTIIFLGVWENRQFIYFQF